MKLLLALTSSMIGLVALAACNNSINPNKTMSNLTNAALPEPVPFVKRLRIWSHPVWAGLLVALLGAFWTGRKITGVI